MNTNFIVQSTNFFTAFTAKYRNIPAFAPRLWSGTSATLVLLSLLPIGYLCFFALQTEGLHSIIAVFSGESGLRMIINTALLSLFVGIAGTGIGAVSAYVQVLIRPRGRYFLHGMSMLPLAAPPFLIPAALLVIWGRGGVIGGVFSLSFPAFFGGPALAATQVLCFYPTAYLLCLRVLQAVNPQLTDTATTLGAGAWQVARELTLPALSPALRRSFGLLVLASSADLANPLVLAGDYEVLSRGAYMAAVAQYNMPLAASYALVLLTVNLSLLGFTGGSWGISLASATRLYTHRRGPGRLAHRPWVGNSLTILAWMPVAVNLGVVITVVVGAFTSVVAVDSRFSLRHVAYTLGSAQLISNTVYLAAIAAVLTVLIGVGLAQLSGQGRWGKLLVRLCDVALSIPGTVWGIAFLLCFAAPITIGEQQLLPGMVGGMGVGGGAVVIIYAYVLRTAGLSVALLRVAFARISPAGMAAGLSLGVEERLLRRVLIVPAIWPTVLVAMTLSFFTAVSSISALAFISSSRWNLLTLHMLAQVDEANYGSLFAAGLLILLLTAGLAALSGHWSAAGDSRYAGRRKKVENDCNIE